MLRSHIALAVLVVGSLQSSVSGKIIGVTGPLSSRGVSAREIAAPPNMLAEHETNRAQQGFNERQGVATTQDFQMDSGLLPAGSLVNSHMIFLNGSGTDAITHENVVWTFDGSIIGVMSDSGGTYEAASTGELGHPDTNYTNPLRGAAAPFVARGLEGNDGYTISNNALTLSLYDTNPGDWLRVVTAPTHAPEPSTLVSLLGLGLVGFAAHRMRRRKKAS